MTFNSDRPITQSYGDDFRFYGYNDGGTAVLEKPHKLFDGDNGNIPPDSNSGGGGGDDNDDDNRRISEDEKQSLKG